MLRLFWVFVCLFLVTAAFSSEKPARIRFRKSGNAGHKESVNSKAPRVLIPVHNGFEEIELVTMAGILRRAGAQVTIASVHPGKLELVGMMKMKITADADFEEVKDQDYDLIASPGGVQNSRGLGSNPSVVQVFRKQQESGKWFAAICASPKLLLENNGLLENYLATGYPSLSLNSASQTSGTVVVSRNLITSSNGKKCFRIPCLSR